MMGAYRFQDWYIPERMVGAIKRYIEQGILPGDFLRAVICNDLKEAVGWADDENLANLPAYVGYFYNEAPSPCWGSKEKMIAWVDKFKVRDKIEESPGIECEGCGGRINPDYGKCTRCE